MHLRSRLSAKQNPNIFNAWTGCLVLKVCPGRAAADCEYFNEVTRLSGTKGQAVFVTELDLG